MSIRESLEEPTESSYFAGVRIGQAWKDLLLWEQFFQTFESKALFELGTWRGAMSIFFAVQCHARSMKFVTVDLNPCEANAANTVRALGGILHNFDIFAEESRAQQIISELPRPLVLFCDNGSKPEEFRRFVPCLEKDDFVAVHDWGTEFFESNLVYPVEQVMVAESEELESITRFYRV